MSWKYQISSSNTWKYNLTSSNQWGYVYNDGRFIPNLSSALFWIDGEISGSEFVDKSGNGRNFTITDKDFTASYFPYKSAATISAPVGDAVLIAADINNFLYDSGGTPNAIPARHFFQNIDYENKIFCRNIDRSVDSLGIEIISPHVVDIVMYSTALTDSDLTQANSYYGVPTKLTALWVGKGGNDTTGDGSEGSPYLTVQKAVTESSVGGNVYIKTGTYIETSYLSIAKSVSIYGLSSVVIQSTGASYVARIAHSETGGTNRFENLDLDCRTLSNVAIQDNSPITSAIYIYTKAGLLNYARSAIRIDAVSSTVTVNDCMIKTARIIGNTFGLTTNITNYSTNIFTMRGNYINDNSYYGVKANTSAFQYNKTVTSGTANYLYSFYSTGVAVDYRYNEHYCTSTSTAVIKSAVYIVGATTINISYNLFKNTGINPPFNSINIFGDAGTATTSCLIANNHIENETINSHVLSIGTEETDAGDNQISNIIIEKNTVLCFKYFDTDVNGGTHSIFVGFQKDAIIRYNYVNGGGINIIYKGSTATANTTGYIAYNVSVNAYLNNYMIKAISNLPVYGNTAYNNLTDGDRSYLYMFYFLANIGEDHPENCIMKNNIIVDDSDTVSILINILATTIFTSNYNVMYSKSGYYGNKNGATDQSFSQWQTLGYDANSDELTPTEASNLLEDTANEDWSLASGSAAIGAGETLAAAYDDGLDASTDWGDDSTVPSVVTKQQTVPWDIGAYVS